MGLSDTDRSGEIEWSNCFVIRSAEEIVRHAGGIGAGIRESLDGLFEHLAVPVNFSAFSGTVTDGERRRANDSCLRELKARLAVDSNPVSVMRDLAKTVKGFGNDYAVFLHDAFMQLASRLETRGEHGSF